MGPSLLEERVTNSCFKEVSKGKRVLLFDDFKVTSQVYNDYNDIDCIQTRNRG